MDAYPLVKTIHILSATVLFGTGLGIAFFFWSGGRSGDDTMALFAARTTVRADLIFTVAAGIIQPLTGAWLIWRLGYDPAERWLIFTYALYALAGACWAPVVWIQLRIRDQLAAKVAGGPFDAVLHRRLRRWWPSRWG